jgi:hypothetical protein
MTKTTHTNPEHFELSARDLEQVSGGIAWFPIIMALARFGLSRASHNGGGGDKALVPQIELPPSEEEVGIRSSTPA